tara:strand:+ start:238 stop:375 length:138 start_codon:yes stop_codon:yes gene_type:complete
MARSGGNDTELLGGSPSRAEEKKKLLSSGSPERGGNYNAFGGANT